MAYSTVEQSLARKLRRHGYKLCKVPSRHWERKWYGIGYHIVLVEGNTWVRGGITRQFDATLEEVADFAAKLQAA